MGHGQGWCPTAGVKIAKGNRGLLGRGLLPLALLAWFLPTLVVLLSFQGTDARLVSTLCASWIAEAFAAVVLFLAFPRGGGTEKRPWQLFALAVALRLLADVVWVATRAFGLGLAEIFQVVAHGFSYALFFVVLLWLMSTLRKEMVSVAALDTLSVMLTSGLIVWYFFLGSGTGLDALGVLARLARPVLDLGLLFLGLAALLSVRRPHFVIFLAGGLLALLVANGAYLWTRVSGVYELGAAEALWSGGIMVLAFAALSWGGERVPPAEHVGDYGIALFWFGPLSPLLQYAVLLLSGAIGGPLPRYVLLGGVVLTILMCGRMFAINRAMRRQARRQEALARQAEGGRIMRELHDTIKQGVHGTSLMIEAATLAERRGDAPAVRDLLEKALETSRETGHELSKPMDELRLLSGHAVDPAAFFGEKLRQFGEGFGMETHEDLTAPLAELSPDELRVAHRVFVEAAWNAAKHSGAGNLWLETRREASGFVLCLRDDGRGFDPATEGGGYGLHSMRSRAEEAGAKLVVSSVPGTGTVVELRFDG